MKTFLSIAFVLGVFLICPCIRVEAQEKPIYRLVWEDQFDASELDEVNNWTVEIDGKGGGNEELQYYRRENISVGHEPETNVECLIITARRESYEGCTATSGRLTTLGKQSFLYGKVEARIKLPATANGLWPAFWMMGADKETNEWPSCGEIDIMEMGHEHGIKTGTQTRYFNGACHWGYVVDGGYPNYAKHTTADYDLHTGFHLYTLVWTDKVLQMYLDQDRYPDALPYFELDITDRADDRSTGYYFHKPYYVLFNLAVGGRFPGLFDINSITALNTNEVQMYVDYVRVYQLDTLSLTIH